MFENIDQLRELAIYYEKHKEMPFQSEWNDLIEDLNKGNKGKTKIMPTFELMSQEAQEFGNKWRSIFINGMTDHRGCPYTGEHIFYLNVVQMEASEEVDRGDIFKSDKRVVAKRTVSFPKFWDEDFRYFWTCEIARNGIGPKKYKRICELGINLGLVNTPDNLAGGLNHVWLKPRGVGASWKGGCWNCYNLYLLPATQNFIFADNDNFLGDKDGIFSKFVKIRDFIQDNVWFLWKNFSTESPSEKVFQTGLKTNSGGSRTTGGFRTGVTGIIINGNPDLARGKRGNGTFEEFGSFPKIASVWSIYDSSTNNNGQIFGQARGFGTGGDKKQNYVDLEKMFRNPKDYRLLEFENTYENNAEKSCAMFTPAWINIVQTDENGNSLVKESKKLWDDQVELLKASSDPEALTNFLAEKPGEPNHAFNAIGVNIFPRELLKARLDYLEVTDEDKKVCSFGSLVRRPGGGIKLVITGEKPLEAYPITRGLKKEGAVAIRYQPHTINGRIPKDLYRIAVDGYTQNDAEHSESIFDVRVIENSNNLTATKGDVIVAWWRGRFSGSQGQYQACDILFKLAEMYGCLKAVAIENDQPGEIVSHAKLYRDTQGRRLTMYLSEQFQLDNLTTAGGKKLSTAQGMKRDYGMNVTPYRKDEGMTYLREWFLRPRAIYRDERGVETIQINIDYIWDRGFLREAIGYNGGNADAISSMIVAMYHEKELKYDNRYAGKDRKRDEFFQKQLFV